MWKLENSLEAQGRLENIEEFINSLGDFSSMVEFLEYVSLIEARDDKNLTDAVTVMTVHGAKGLEFDLVFVPGLEDGLFPSGRSIEEKGGVEEERRLMYVAITRAKKELILSYAKSRYVFGDYQMQMPSRFIKELPQEEVEFEELSFGGSRNFYGAGLSGNSRENSWTPRSEFRNDAKKSILESSYKNVSQANSSASSSSNIKDAMFGRRVFHQKFGYGKVVSSDGNKLEILFEKTGTKTVMKDFVTAA